MRRFFKPILVGVLVSGFLVAAGVAADYGLIKTRERAGLPTTIAGESTIPEIIGRVVSVGLSLLGVIFFLLVLYAGLTWMTALGNAEKVDKAKSIIEMAVLGLILVVAAYAIANFVFDSLSQDQRNAGGNDETEVCAVGSIEGETICAKHSVCECGKAPAESCDTVGRCVDKCAYLTLKSLLKNGVCTDVRGSGGQCPAGKVKAADYCPGSDDSVLTCCHDP